MKDSSVTTSELIAIPERLGYLRDLICNANKDGSIPLNALVFEGRNLVNTYNALAEQRDELAEALRPFAGFACDEPCLCHNCKARAALAKLDTDSTK